MMKKEAKGVMLLTLEDYLGVKEKEPQKG